jgi:hypothetical protein
MIPRKRAKWPLVDIAANPQRPSASIIVMAAAPKTYFAMNPLVYRRRAISLKIGNFWYIN